MLEYTSSSFEKQFETLCKGKKSCTLDIKDFKDKLSPPCQEVEDKRVKASAYGSTPDPTIPEPNVIVTALCEVSTSYSSLGFKISKNIAGIIIVSIDCFCILIYLIFVLRLEDAT